MGIAASVHFEPYRGGSLEGLTPLFGAVNKQNGIKRALSGY